MVDGILGTWLNFHKTVIPNVLLWQKPIDQTEACLCCIIFTSRAVGWWAEDDTTLLQTLSVPFLLYPFFSHSFFLLAICFRILQTGIHKIPIMYYLIKGDHELSRCFRSTLSSESVSLSLSLFLFVCSCWSFVADIRFVSSSHLCVIISVFSLFTLFCSCVKMLNLWWVPLSSPHQTQGEWTSLDCGHIDRSYTQIY